jgi:hypothetical protein
LSETWREKRRALAGVAELTPAAPEAELIEPMPAAVHPPWLKPLSSYSRREAHEFCCARYG